jgi:hypothetical protein
MDANDAYYQSLPDRIKDGFPEIDNEITTELRKRDEGYLALFRESDNLQSEFPVIMEVLEGEGEISITADEHAALVRYLAVKQEMEDMERRHIYFRGHTDTFAYLKEIGAVYWNKNYFCKSGVGYKKLTPLLPFKGGVYPMPYIDPEVILQVKRMDLLTYLQNYEPQELVHFSGSVYCTRAHDSLKISNGKWCWHSRGIGGRSALDYLIKVNGITFTAAVEQIMGHTAIKPPVFISKPKEPPKPFIMPPL